MKSGVIIGVAAGLVTWGIIVGVTVGLTTSLDVDMLSA